MPCCSLRVGLVGVPKFEFPAEKNPYEVEGSKLKLKCLEAQHVKTVTSSTDKDTLCWNWPPRGALI